MSSINVVESVKSFQRL